jgi:hypothetical protein
LIRYLTPLLLLGCTATSDPKPVDSDTPEPIADTDEGTTVDTDPVDTDPPPIDTGDGGETAVVDTSDGPGETVCDGFDDDGDGLIDEDFDRDNDGEARCCVETEYVLWYADDAVPRTAVSGRPFAAATGIFGPISDFTPIEGDDITVLAYGHFNETIGSADHTRDILWRDAQRPAVYFLTQCLYGEWQRTTIDVPWRGAPRSWGDFNNDDCMDFVEYDYQSSTFGSHGDTGNGRTFLGQCNGRFQRAPNTDWHVRWLEGQWVGGMAYNSSDWNGDGNQDLLMWSISNGGSAATRVAYLPGNGQGDFGEPITVGDSAVAANSPAMGDINGDGHVDVVLGPNDDGGPQDFSASGQIFGLLGNGSAGTLGNPLLIDPGWTTFASEDGDGAARLWDYDKDGDLDIIATHEASNIHGIGYFENDGTGHFPQSPTTEILEYYSTTTPVFVPIHQE